MKLAVLRRLSQLEERRAAALHSAQSRDVGERATRWFEELVRLLNAQPGPHESRLDALARCLGLRSWELRGLMLGNLDEFKRVVWEVLKPHQQSRGGA